MLENNLLLYLKYFIYDYFLNLWHILLNIDEYINSIIVIIRFILKWQCIITKYFVTHGLQTEKVDQYRTSLIRNVLMNSTSTQKNLANITALKTGISLIKITYAFSLKLEMWRLCENKENFIPFTLYINSIPINEVLLKFG